MRYFYVILAAAGAVLLIVLLLTLLVKLRRRYARKKVCSLCPEEKISRLDKALEPFGFCYEEKDDSISSRMYPWQREMGYFKGYDEAAVAMNMVFDCEPIYFNHAGCRYLIELWKGQYGCTTGAEIGVYVNRSGDFEKSPEDLFYECARDEERLPMRFSLIKNGCVILRRNAVHWWLTGFLAGMFSKPEELVLEAAICFPNPDMRRAFCIGLLRAGYSERDICVENNTVLFSFANPHTKQPRSHHGWYRRWIMRRNRRNCRRYCRITKCFCSTLDRISFLGYCFPALYRLLIRMGTKCSRGKYEKCAAGSSCCKR